MKYNCPTDVCAIARLSEGSATNSLTDRFPKYFLTMKRELTDAQGHIFAKMEYDPPHNMIITQWIGHQDEERVRQWGPLFVEMLRQHGASKLLNDSREVTGSWDEVNDYLAYTLAPQALAAGLQCFAHVVPAGLDGKMSIVDLHRKLGDRLKMKVFLSEEEAITWLDSSA